MAQYVICPCQHCKGHIEFDANEFAEENSIVPCPHCGLETKLFLPISLTPQLSSSIVSPAVKHEGFFYEEPTAQEAGANESIHKIPAQVSSTENQESQNTLSVSKKEIPTTEPYRHKRTRFTKGTKVALTPAQCATPTGQELVDLLRNVVRDGLISEEGVRRLNTWLDGKADSDFPAIKFLLQTSDRILRTGKVTTARAFNMHFAIERVLPKNFRGGVKETRQKAWQHSQSLRKATPAQLDYIRGLGGTPPPELNFSEASRLIEELGGGKRYMDWED